MKNVTTVWEQLKTLVILVSSLIVTMPTVTFAASAKEPDPAIVQVKDNLHRINEVATQWEKTGGCSGFDCVIIDNLASAGKLTAVPPIPVGIGDGKSDLSYGWTQRRMGGCGSLNRGAQQNSHPALENVSEPFCRMYNDSVGLGKSIVENCRSGGDCSASGSDNPYDFPIVNSSSFCYRRVDQFTVIWISTIGSVPCPQ